MRLGSRASANKRFAEADRHHAVALAVQHQERRRDARDAQVGAERVFHEPAHRHERIGGGADVGGRGERRIEHHAADGALGGERNGDRGAERLAPQHDALGRIARGGEVVGRNARRGSARLRSACRSSRHSRDRTAPAGRCRRRSARRSVRRAGSRRRHCPGNRAPPACRRAAARARRSAARRRRW